MARKRKRKNPTLSRTKRLIGIVCALLVLCAALLDTRGSAFFSLNAGAEETPKLAHYVNQKDEAVNGNVHIDLETGKETFSFDIQAYIPADAVKLVITEPLSPVFSFVNADTVYRCQFQEASEWGKNPALSGESFMVPECRPVVTIDRSDSVREVLTAELDLSGLSDEVKAQVRGKWLHLGFDVRISDGHSYDEGMLNYVFSTYKDAPPVPVNEPVYDAPPGPHNGLKAQAS